MKGTNAIVLGIALGKSFGSSIGATIHLDDVADAHVKALDPDIPGNRSYILSQQMNWEDVKGIVERDFPDAALPNSGRASTIEIEVDASETENALGRRFSSFDDQVRSVVGHYLELGGRKGSKTKSKSDGQKGRRDSALLEFTPDI